MPDDKQNPKAVPMDELEANFRRAELLWDEYKYRHGLCWRLLFQLTFAIVIISVIPYTYDDEVKPKELLLFVLALAMYLNWITIKRISHEIDLWEDVKKKHDDVRKTLKIPNLTGKNPEDFRKDILTPLRLLFCLGIGNIIFRGLTWLL